ncbi:MAG: carboxypeptidase-like regulatory domain-containing protein [Bacteroidetes bacterium]|nr:carboxypeptidase-like regulatory domain-containing protein [Bacteroidota bacterium]
MRRTTRHFLMLVILGLFISGCSPDAPHSNPFDPMSPNYSPTGVLTGKVLSLSAPYIGISRVLVTIEQTGDAQYTSSDGSFSFSTAPTGNVTIVATKPSYLADTLNVNLQVGKTYNEEIHIDALPQVSSAEVITSKIDQWWPGPVYSALVTASAIDPDGIADLDSIYVRVDSLTFPMNYSITDKNFQATIDAAELPNQDLQWLIGRELVVSAVDKAGGVGQSAGFYVSRIIEPEANPTYPASLDTTTGTPTFDWNPPSVSYNYTYQLQVVSLAGGTQTVVWSVSGLSSSDVSYSYPGVLPSGSYFWTAAVVDDFGNSSRSKEASFVVP